jgi:hypothetical protein
VADDEQNGKLTGRLVGGPLDGMVVEIPPNTNELAFDDASWLVTFGSGSPPSLDGCIYRRVGVEDGADPAATHDVPQRVIFEFVDPDW